MNKNEELDIERWIIRKSYRLVKSINNCKDADDLKSRAIAIMEVTQIIEELASDAGIHYKLSNLRVTRKKK